LWSKLSTKIAGGFRGKFGVSGEGVELIPAKGFNSVALGVEVEDVGSVELWVESPDHIELVWVACGVVGRDVVSVRGG